MAYFRINLLTPQTNTNTQGVCFLETPISEFYNQQDVYNSKTFSKRQYTYCYTFNEKFSSHDNGQKELTFSMMRNIWLDNELTQNPFVTKLKIGTQVLLIDKYENEYFFTITDIKYKIHDSNILYDYVCNDSFTYQHIRQNDGYEIKNDSTSSDFIGSQTIDWWASKIKNECHISYEYVPLSYGLYLSHGGSLKLFSINENITDVKKIIKPPFPLNNELNIQYLAYPEYYEAIPFSSSGGNASSTLIALGEELGLSLNYTEHNVVTNNTRSNRFVRYFWFEPKKNDKVSNIKYSPSINIQSFDFSHGGSALTTILNVDSNTIGEELITMLPETPPFFSQVFSSTDWETSHYENGYFTQICQQKTYYSEDGYPGNNNFTIDLNIGNTIGKNSWVDSENECIYLSLYSEDESTLKIPLYYNKVRLYDSINKKNTSLFIGDDYYSNSTSFMEFVVGTKTKDENNNEVIVFSAYNESNPIPDNLLGMNLENCYLRIYCNWEEELPLLNEVKVCLSFYRDATDDELNFASMADKCPWLENKLIDFSYFLDQKIISPAEYKKLINTITDDLRIVNGKLLYYSKGYYDAIRKKTKEMADLLSTIDSIGAAFNSDIVEAYKTNGVVETTSYFRKAYNTFLSKYTTGTQTTPILNYNELLTEYLNKYIQAQQRFLKNIYYFKQYFSQRINWGPSETINLAKKRLVFDDLETTSDYSGVRRYLSFRQKPSYVLVNKDFSKYDENYTPQVKIYESDKITEVEVVDKTNYQSYYVSTITKNDMTPCGNKESYDSKIKYFRRLYKTNIDAKKTLKDSFIHNEIKYNKHSENQEFIWYGFAMPDSKVGELPDSIEHEGITLTLDYVRVYKTDIINEWLYNSLFNDRNQVVYEHSTDTNANTNSWFVFDDVENTFLNFFTPKIFTKILSEKDYDDSSYTALTNALRDPNLINKSFSEQPEVRKDAINYYKAHFPITSVTYKGQSYTDSPYSTPRSSTVLDYQPTNKAGDTYTQYLDYLVLKELKGENPRRTIKNPFRDDEKVTFSIPVVNATNEQDFFRRVPGTAATAAAWTIGAVGFVAGLAVSFFGGPILGAALTTLATSEAVKAYYNGETEWKASGSNTQAWDMSSFDKLYYTGYHDKEKIIYACNASAYNEYSALRMQAQADSSTKAQEIKDIKVIKVDENIPAGYQELERNNGKIIVYSLKPWSEKEYYNYYSKIGLTYSSARSHSSTLDLKYEDAFLQPVLLNDRITKSCSYKLLNFEDLGLASNEGMSWKDIFGERNISKVKYYFIDKAGMHLDTSEIAEGTTWKEFFESQFRAQGTEVGINQSSDFYRITITGNSTEKSFIILKEQHFTRKNINILSNWNGNYLKPNKRYSLYSGEDLFDIDDVEIDLSAREALLAGFYRHAEEDAGYIPASQFEIQWVDPIETTDVEGETTETIAAHSTKFFKQVEDDYIEVPTITQIKTANKYFYIQNDEYTIDTLSNVYDFGKLKIYYHQETYQNGELILGQDQTFVKEGFATFKFDDDDQQIKVSFIDEKNIEFSRLCTLELDQLGEQVNNITNGQFWYLYHNRTDCPLLFDRAATIEAELTLYWGQAYSASFGCEYFLPPSWQPRVDGGTNYFNNHIVKIGNDNQVFLSNWYLPDVAIYKENNQSTLPKYTLEYNPTPGNEQSLINGGEFIYPNHKTSASHALSPKHPISLALKELQEELSNIVVNKSNSNSQFGKTTYFYNKNNITGTRWSEFITKHSNESFVYNLYSGNYIMTYAILKNKFSENYMGNYESSKEQQQLVWQKLYENYPGILLESSFSNEAATSSIELYNLATAAFKDKQTPERNYNISLIDIYNNLQVKENSDNNWMKYYGQELKIGDGILVDVDEYYDTPDDVYKTISQYLFITDISYELRKDSDINITVNTIKYQDKLIKRLAKLIK